MQTPFLRDDNIQNALATLQNHLSQGNFSSQTDLLKTLEQTYNQLNTPSLQTSFDAPLFSPGETLNREALTDPYVSAADDLTRLWNQWDVFRQRLVVAFNQQQGEIVGLDAQIAKVQTLLTHFQLTASDKDSDFLWSGDSFRNTDQMDIQQTTAYLDTKGHQLLLKLADMKDLTDQISGLNLDRRSSQGLPGNNLTIAKSGPNNNPDTNPEPQPELEIDTNGHSLMGALFDGNPNTWFEWEMNYIPQHQPLRKIGTAYVYDPAGKNSDVLAVTGNKGWGWKRYILWPGQTDWDRGPDGTGFWLADFKNRTTPTLVFTVQLLTPQVVSAIVLEPILLGSTYPVLKSLTISKDGHNWLTVAQNTPLNLRSDESEPPGIATNSSAGKQLYTLPTSSPIQYIQFKFEGGAFYTPINDFGHKYYVKRTQETTQHSGFFGIGAHTDTWVQDTREPNPEQGLITVPQSQGVDTKGLLTSVGTIAGAFIPGVGSFVGGLIGGAVGSLVDNLFSSKHTSKLLDVENHYDIFSGQRSVIAIQNIGISLRTYEATSQYISKVHTFPQGLKAVSLIATENIPTDWVAGNWVNYFISTDGQTWKPITPQNRTHSTDTIIDLNGERNLFVRIDLSRPELPGESAAVLAYALKGAPLL